MFDKLEKYMIGILSTIIIMMSVFIYYLYLENILPKCYNDPDAEECKETFQLLA
tara:strand:- start:33 stop:194 length:162 start_codon:yes stop_codon:yes gene_type:complete